MSCYKDLRSELLELLTKDESTENLSPISAKEVLPQVQTDIEVVEISDEDTMKNLDQVQCPVCGQFMGAKRLQERHLDYCLKGEAEPKATLAPRSSKPSKPISSERKRGGISLFFLVQKRVRPSPPPQKQSEHVDHLQFYFKEVEKHHRDTKRLPKIDYSSLSITKLKEKLAALKLLTTGSRTQLELRYNQFYLLYNSNIDLSRPVSDLELRQKLNQWEKSHQGFSVAKSASNVYGDELKYKALSDKDFPIKGWLTRYKAEYSELVRAARASHLKKMKASANLGSSSNSGMMLDEYEVPSLGTNGNNTLSPPSTASAVNRGTIVPTSFETPSSSPSTPHIHAPPNAIADHQGSVEPNALSSSGTTLHLEFAAKPGTLSYIGHNYASSAAALPDEASIIEDEEPYNFSNSVLSSK